MNWSRLFASLISLTLISVVIFSNVQLNLGVVSGRPAAGLALLYAGLMAYFVVKPSDGSILHVYAGILGVFIFMGRAGGFLELAFDRGSWALTGAIMERVVLAVLVLRWHMVRLAHPST